jgi:hypothetical protein
VRHSAPTQDGKHRLHVCRRATLRCAESAINLGDIDRFVDFGDATRMFAYERRENFNDLWVIQPRVAGYAFQSVDPAETYVEFAMAKLLDGPREAISKLT